jgi:hypothetical protein
MLFIVFGGSRKPKSTYTKTSYTNFVKTIIISDCHGQPHLIEKQAEDPSLSREGMNAVQFPAYQ